MFPSSFLLALVTHTRKVYSSGAKNQEEDYWSREGGEIDTQVYPAFPILKERGVYENSLDIEDNLCHKEFPSHRKLTPGIYVMTCGCKHKVMSFDLVMTRFERNCNPHIIFDASCWVKEYGLSRELKRFMNIKKNYRPCSWGKPHKMLRSL